MADKRTARTAIHTRVETLLVQRVDDWRRLQPEIPPRSKAICELLELALRAEDRRQPKPT
jgi:hypothetical protein